MGNTASGSAKDEKDVEDVLQIFVREVRKHITYQNKQCQASCESNSNYYLWNANTLPNMVYTANSPTFFQLQKVIDTVIGTLKNMPPEQLRSWCVSNFDVLHHVCKYAETYRDIGLTSAESDALLAAVSWKEHHMEYALEHYRKDWHHMKSFC
jgi:hypothetical protein